MTRRELIKALTRERDWIYSNARQFFDGLNLGQFQVQASRLDEAYQQLEEALNVLKGFDSAGVPEVGNGR
jgi:hypothetical protein